MAQAVVVAVAVEVKLLYSPFLHLFYMSLFRELRIFLATIFRFEIKFQSRRRTLHGS